MNADKGEDRQEDHRWRNHLHHANAKVAKTSVDPQRAALFGFGEEETDVTHARGKVSASKTAQQSDDDKYPERSSGVLNGDT